LESYLDVELGETVAPLDSYEGTQETTEPWIIPSCTEQDINDTLEAFNGLVDVVETRMPTWPVGAIEYGLVDLTDSTISTIFPKGFAHRIISLARRLRFFTIAPGLQIATHKPFATRSIEQGKTQPFPIFESTLPAHHDTQRAPWDENVPTSPLQRDSQSVASLSCRILPHRNQSARHTPVRRRLQALASLSCARQ